MSTISKEYQEQLKTALLLLCFYDLGAAEEEFHAELDEPEDQDEYEYQQDTNDY